MPSAEEIRAGQRTTWAGLSSSWDKWETVILDQLAPAGEAIIDGLDLSADAHVLDIASGTGEPGLTIAQRVPQGRVTLTDLSPEMVAVAQRRAADIGIDNVATHVCSADDLPFGDASFDGVSVRFGFMFFPDLAQTTAELVRVLKPGGRLGAAVWIDPGRNPWSSVVVEAIAAELPVPAPDPNAPSMFRCAAPGLVAGLYESAGLESVTETEVSLDLVTDSPEEYWDMISDHVSLVNALLQNVDEAARQRVRADVIQRLGQYERDGKIRVPGLARCIVGTKPETGV